MGIGNSVCSIADAVKYACKSIGSAIYSAAGRVLSGATYFAGMVARMLRGFYDRVVSAVYSVAGSVRSAATYIASLVDGIFHGLFGRGRAARDEGVKLEKESVTDKEVLQKILGFVLPFIDVVIEIYTRGFTGGFPVYGLLKQALVKKYVETVDHVKIEELLRRVGHLEHVVFGWDAHHD